MRLCKLFFAISLAGFACSPGATTQPNDPNAADPDNTATAGAPDNTFDHENVQIDSFDYRKRLNVEGDQEIAAHYHSCQKLKYATLGNILSSRGANMASTTAGSAAVLYKGGAQALGAPDYAARTAEAILPTTAGGTKEFDIYVQAAPEIIANIGNAADAKLAGQPVAIFDAQGQCNADGLTAIMGYPASAQHVAICNQIVSSSSTPQVGQRVAVAAFLSAANFCE
jgi:hypothetical protein